MFDILVIKFIYNDNGGCTDLVPVQSPHLPFMQIHKNCLLLGKKQNTFIFEKMFRHFCSKYFKYYFHLSEQELTLCFMANKYI
jgi:hypothetical protein